VRPWRCEKHKENVRKKELLLLLVDENCCADGVSEGQNVVVEI
jgi:hypothetical protein